jgi:hypothetical protein
MDMNVNKHEKLKLYMFQLLVYDLKPLCQMN